jgi:hypothetical protein
MINSTDLRIHMPLQFFKVTKNEVIEFHPYTNSIIERILYTPSLDCTWFMASIKNDTNPSTIMTDSISVSFHISYFLHEYPKVATFQKLS